MRIATMDGFALEEALLPDDPTVTFAELRARHRVLDEDGDEEWSLRRLLEYPDELAPSFLYEVD